jgi:tetratricopeptide (TPR) repeat protein
LIFPKTPCIKGHDIYDFVLAMKLKRSQLISQGSLSRMLQAADQAWNRRDFQQCIEILERASRLDPANRSILMNLGGMHGKCFDYASAERCFEKAVRIAPKKLEALAAAGGQCREFGNYEMSESYFKRAAEQKEATPEILIRLAEIYERLRRMNAAAELIDRALRLNGACAAALLARARLERQAGCFEAAEKLLRSFLPTTEKEICIRGWYELGGILDRQGRYDEAMAAFFKAKALLHSEATPHAAKRQTMRARLKELRANLTPEKLQSWANASQSFQPIRRLALLCGHPRSGTTLLEQVLDSHPDIVSAEETQIFHDHAYMLLARGQPENSPLLTILESAQDSTLRQSRENYTRNIELFLDNPVGNRLLIDKNPSLTFLIPAFVRIFPEAKLLVALRDPRDVCLSCFMQPFVILGMTNSAYLTLQDTIQDYVEMMSMWTTLAPMLKNPRMEVRYEDMVRDLGSVSKKTLNFLDISWDERVLRFDEHARQKLVRSPTYADVAKPVFKTAVGRWRNYQKYLEPCLEKLAPFLKAFGYE